MFVDCLKSCKRGWQTADLILFLQHNDDYKSTKKRSYSMSISHKHKFVFVHIYKTAGTSVMDVFLPYFRLVDRMAYQYKFCSIMYYIIVNLIGWHDDGMKQFTGFHKHAKVYEIEKGLGRSRFESYYKFVFVRNVDDETSINVQASCSVCLYLNMSNQGKGII